MTTVEVTDDDLTDAIKAVRDNAWPLSNPMKIGATGKKLFHKADASSFNRGRDKEWAKEAKTLDVPDPVIIDRDRLLLPCRAEWENLAKGYAKIARKASERFMQMDTAINYAKRKLEEAEHLPSFLIDWLTKLS